MLYKLPALVFELLLKARDFFELICDCSFHIIQIVRSQIIFLGIPCCMLLILYEDFFSSINRVVVVVVMSGRTHELWLLFYIFLSVVFSKGSRHWVCFMLLVSVMQWLNRSWSCCLHVKRLVLRLKSEMVRSLVMACGYFEISARSKLILHLATYDANFRESGVLSVLKNRVLWNRLDHSICKRSFAGSASLPVFLVRWDLFVVPQFQALLVLIGLSPLYWDWPRCARVFVLCLLV